MLLTLFYGWHLEQVGFWELIKFGSKVRQKHFLEANQVSL